MTNLNALSSKLSDPTPDLPLFVRGINPQTLPKISFGNLSLDKVDSDFLRPTYVIEPKNAVLAERYPVQVN